MLLWAEPWDQYGGTQALVANSGYTDVGLSGVNSPGRTGLKAAWAFNAGITRRALDTLASVLGQGAGVCTNGGASSNFNGQGFRWDSAAKTFECGVNVMDDLGFGVYDRTGALKGRTAPNQAIQGSFVWLEAKATINTGGGANPNTGIVEVRVNGIQKLVVNGINLPNQFAYHGFGGTAGGNNFWDDWIVWDDSGASNNNFMGDRRLFVSYPNANLATQDFTPTPAGNAYDRVNDAPPNDAAYIAAAAAGNVSEFSKDAIGINSTDIAAVVAIARLFKSDAGVASGRIGINSNGFVSNSAAQFPGVTGAWFRQIVELDPNGAIPWTKAAADAAALRVTRDS